MCTLVVLNEYVKDFPLVVAANRDEAYDRPSAAPSQVLTPGNVRIIYPRDNKAGGTWIGAAQDGWFVGITNQDDGKHEEGKKTRGRIIEDCLWMGNHSAVARYLVKLDPKDFNPFNLVFGRPGAMFLCRVFPGRDMELDPLPAGISIITNDCWGTQYQSKVQHAQAMVCHLDPSERDGAGVVGAMQMILNDHWTGAEDPFQSLCVHDDEHGFGTRSSSIITVSTVGQVEYWYSEGHPCKSLSARLMGRLDPLKKQRP